MLDVVSLSVIVARLTLGSVDLDNDDNDSSSDNNADDEDDEL